MSDALEILRENGELQKKTVLWNSFLRKSHLEEQTSLQEAVGKIRAFVEPPASAVVGDQPFELHRPPGGPWQESTWVDSVYSGTMIICSIPARTKGKNKMSTNCTPRKSNPSEARAGS